MNGLVRDDRRNAWFTAKRSPLTVTWAEQLLSEAVTAVRLAETEEELARAVRLLAKLTYGRLKGMGLGELWTADDETVAQQLPLLIKLSGDLAEYEADAVAILMREVLQDVGKSH